LFQIEIVVLTFMTGHLFVGESEWPVAIRPDLSKVCISRMNHSLDVLIRPEWAYRQS
jgi:hypothetical protein